MSSDRAAVSSLTPGVRLGGATLMLFVGLVFLSALLLFWVQPMFAKMVLPMLGGAPAVWNTAMMFFQIALLAGYAYAHALGRIKSLNTQMLVHLSLLALAALTLPLGVADGWTAPTDAVPIPWLLGLLTISVGLPFFALSASAPLLQRWFAMSGQPGAADPYFLYAASNLGSMIGLLGYPLAVEPGLRLAEQSFLWASLYGVLAVATVGLAVMLAGRKPAHAAAQAPAPAAPPLNVTRRIYWIALAFVPSSLLLGLTQHITTDLAAMPLLWVVPLSLYLLSFVVVFARRPWISGDIALLVQPHFLVVLALFFGIAGNLALTIPLHLLTFFIVALVCHGQLAQDRPHTAHLTEFYLWMSFGGMLGGVFNALAAPMLFDAIYEYPLALILACLLRPAKFPFTARGFALDLALPAALLALIWAVLGTGYLSIEGFPKEVMLVIFLAVGIAVFSFRHRPLRLALGVGVAMLPSILFLHDTEVLAKARSFFGVYKVQTLNDGKILTLAHGTTYHGAEIIGESGQPEALTYYSKPGPLGQVFSAIQNDGRFKSVGVIGLGIGSAACHRTPGQDWTFYEIDPLVVEIARDETYFHYLSRCGQDARMVLGDGRLSLAREPDGGFDLLVIDAFSSDAIPMHLLTREAMDLYWRKLSPHGLLMVHISNRHLDLAPVLANIAAAAGTAGLIQYHQPEPELAAERFHTDSIWTVIARDEAGLKPVAENGLWQPLLADKDAPLWTDDFSNLIGVIKR